MELEIRTLTPLWTGGIEPGKMDRLHETGIVGSLRWWYEAILRGLGGWACDPTDVQNCPDKDGKRCAACELFGCTGWQRKFKLHVLDGSKELFEVMPDKDGLVKDTLMIWEFIELRPVCDEEKWLLHQAIRIASEYGAIGGRTPRKPQNNRKVGGDYGLIEIEESRNVPELTAEKAQNYLTGSNLRRLEQTDPRWPNLRYFFFVTGQYLRRESINRLLGLSEDGKQEISNGNVEKALRGSKGVSKKIFSFETSPGRLWGYLPDKRLRDQTINRLKGVKIDERNIRTGEELLNEL